MSNKKWKRIPNPLLPSIIYAGHRQLLPMTHYLRLFGQSGKCCPAGYYDNKQDEVRKSFLDVKVIHASDPSPKILDYRKVAKLQKCCGNEAINFHEQLDLFNGSDIVDLKSRLYYHHCDFRPYKVYARTKNFKYIEDGRAAEMAKSTRKRKLEESNKHIQGTLSIKENDSRNVNGVKGVWPFAKLPYVDMSENICYDPFHVFKNVIVYYFHYLFGKRKISPKVKDFCYKTLSHPTGEIWEITEASASSIESKYFRSVVFSRGN